MQSDLWYAFRLGVCVAHMNHGGGQVDVETLTKCRGLLQQIADGSLTTYPSPEEILPLESRDETFAGDPLYDVMRENREAEVRIATQISNEVNAK